MLVSCSLRVLGTARHTMANSGHCFHSRGTFWVFFAISSRSKLWALFATSWQVLAVTRNLVAISGRSSWPVLRATRHLLPSSGRYSSSRCKFWALLTSSVQVLSVIRHVVAISKRCLHLFIATAVNPFCSRKMCLAQLFQTQVVKDAMRSHSCLLRQATHCSRPLSGSHGSGRIDKK